MPINMNENGPRSAQRAKRRKTNLILNTLIAIVIALILIIGGKIFFGGENPNEPEKQAPATENKEQASNSDKGQAVESEPSEDEPAEDENEPDENEEEGEEEETGELVETPGDEANVEKVIVNPAWKPVGTEQTGGHQPSYSKGSADWNEKLKAAAYATGIPDPDAMTLWWIEGGGDPQNQSVLTIQEKGSDDVYRVYIDWVEGEGWKPTEVKKLIENDKK